MALCPFATVRLIPKHNTRRAPARNRMQMHQAVTTTSSLFGYFSGAGVCSHFYVAQDGALEQYIDTGNYSGADLEGNDATISVETWDDNARAVEWTPGQVATIARLFAWVVSVHPSIPPRLAVDSRLGDSSKGLSWHRLGIDSYPAGKPGWRVADGMHYSTSRGKTCPGDGRIAQIPGILALAVSMTGGWSALVGSHAGVPTPIHIPVPAPAPAPTPPPAGPVVIAPGVPAPPYPLPRGSYFGPKSGPVASVSGFYSHREDLRRWQQRMHDRGWVINPDGLYGNETAGVAHDFQVEKHLGVDSLIGPETWGAAWTAPITR